MRVYRDEATWASLIKEARASGQTIKDWCTMKGISRTTYYHWHSRLIAQGLITASEYEGEEPVKATSSTDSAPSENHPCFVEFIIDKNESSEAGTGSATSELSREFHEAKIMIQRNSYQVFVGNGFAEDTLRKVLEVVGQC